MDSDFIEKKRRGLQFSLDHMPQVIEKIRYRVKPISLENCYSSLANDHLVIGLFEYFINQNSERLKQNLHTACQLKLADIAIDSYQKFEVGSEILYALLSDSPGMVEEMANLKPSHFLSARDNPLHSQFQVHMWQLAIQGDYTALEAKAGHLAKNGRKADHMLAAQGKDFFSLLMRADKSGLESLIRQHADVCSRDALTEDYLSYLATIEAKLCWYRGIPAEIDHPLVPMDLMPIRPLAHYDDVYDFLYPDWVPPTQGLMWKLSRLLGKRT
ncbi:hypothetical protein RO07_11770 [Pandoraea pulmonicola]|uniref:Immunity protein 49 n=1 Tax=Pandoraea pulmonicola TaxID=93221 RepID=A0ABN4F120_PANPU|nr:hypothetical protein RO07_11770 [Pandoraea pulmonicola]